jgi:hypothetical protein
VLEKFNQKQWINDESIHLHAKFEDEQNILQGETKNRCHVCVKSHNSYGELKNLGYIA